MKNPHTPVNKLLRGSQKYVSLAHDTKALNVMFAETDLHLALATPL
jgi:hypothetical protein